MDVFSIHVGVFSSAPKFFLKVMNLVDVNEYEGLATVLSIEMSPRTKFERTARAVADKNAFQRSQRRSAKSEH